jgi:hypothetical protein
VLSVLDLYGNSSVAMAFIPQWIKNTWAFGLVVFFSPDDDLDCSLEADGAPDTLALAISSPRIWGTRREKKRKTNVMSTAKDF